MRYGIFSDAHANYEALKEVLAYFKSAKVDGVVFCGDLLGYGPQPVECVEAVRRLPGAMVVLGNHDAALIGKIDIKWFNPSAAKAIEYSKSKLSGEVLDWLSSLPEKIDAEHFSVVHGSPRNYLKEYVLSENQFLDSMKYVSNDVCFIGHSHMAMYFRLNKEGRVESDFMKPLERLTIGGVKCYINPGSVGQPRDGNPQAACGVYDTEKMVFESVRLRYDVEKVQKLMAEIDMPKLLVERLAMGY